MSAGQPLVGSITLPPAFQEALGEYKKAIKALRDELKEVEKEAKEQLKNNGIVDQALLKKRDALRQVQGGLQDLHDNQMEEKKAAIEKSDAARHVDYGIDLARRAGFSISMPSNVTGTIRNVASSVGDFGAMAKQFGLETAAKSLAKVESSVASAASFVGKSPAIVAALAAGSIVMEETQNRTRAIQAKGELDAMQANTYQSLAGDIGGRIGDTGSVSRAARVFENLRIARAIGTHAPIGLSGRLTDIQGALLGETQAQLDYAKEVTEHENRMEQYRQQYGLDSSPRSAHAELIAKTTHHYKYDFAGGNYAGAMAYNAKGLWYTLTGEGQAYAQQQWDREVRSAEEKIAKSGKAWQETNTYKWNIGAQGALRRVVENEKRRFLRNVETDRISRFNNWGMQ